MPCRVGFSTAVRTRSTSSVKERILQDKSLVRFVVGRVAEFK